MAFASVGSFGTFSSTTADQSSMAFVTSAILEVSNLAVLIIGLDNNQTTDGDEGAVSSITDTGSNTWTKAAEFCNGQGAAQGGATCSIWYSKITTQLASGATITINLTNNTSRDRTTATGWEFTVSGAVSVEATNTLANDGANPGSLNATTANIECLRVRGHASEDSNTAANTATASWTNFTQATASAGGAASSMRALGEFIISTATGAASAPTYNGTVSRDHASVYVAFKEGGNTSLVAAAGAYAFTGTAATARKGYINAAAAGAYAFTGTAATLNHAYKIAAAAGAYAFTGTAAALNHAYKVAAAAGAYAFTGTAATLTKGVTIAAGAGAYAFTGTAAALNKGLGITASAGAYAFTGTAATVNHAYKVAAGAGAYAFTGTAAALNKGVSIAAGAGAYAFTGTAATLNHAYKVAAGAGAYAFTGTAATLTKGVSIAAAAGAYAFTGTSATLRRGWTLAAAAAAYLFSGTAATLQKSGPTLWPATVPVDASNLRERLEGVTRGFAPEVGPPMVRRVASRASTLLDFDTVMTFAQFEDLVTFYRTLEDGSLVLQRPHPRDPTGSDYDFRFAAPPKIRVAGPQHCSVAISLRLLS